MKQFLRKHLTSGALPALMAVGALLLTSCASVANASALAQTSDTATPEATSITAPTIAPTSAATAAPAIGATPTSALSTTPTPIPVTGTTPIASSGPLNLDHGLIREVLPTITAAEDVQDALHIQQYFYADYITWSANETNLLAQSNQQIARANILIPGLQTTGRDVTPVQDALDTFQSQVSQAQTYYNEIESLFNDHPGLNAQGQVTDVPSATTTLQQLSSLEGNFQGLLQPAYDDFFQVLQQNK